MIKNIDAGLQSIHTLIVHCRAEAYNCKNEKLAEDLDTAEYLLALIMQKTDETEQQKKTKIRNERQRNRRC